MITRRSFVQNVSATSIAAFTLRLGALAQVADRRYRNPILGGDHPDASPIRVENDCGC
jgi:xylan 1,4-beta-xylosidase